ncbi:mechanosensitive ion channel domain-containing protein [Microcoleus sp. Pol14D6]|uniref:mechanosensitive ion channel domain-containing protein n=1 Tax=Microcoleus sp. Pol14D6 TaxID=3055402 RepID=UPI002FD2D921
MFKYFLGKILLLLHESFQCGDRIIVEGFEGTVEKILLRSTQIISDRGEPVIVPKAIVIYQFSAGTNNHYPPAHQPAFNFSLQARPS